VGLPLPTILKNDNNPKWDDDFNKRLQEVAWDAVIQCSYSGVKVPAAARLWHEYEANTGSDVERG